MLVEPLLPILNVKFLTVLAVEEKLRDPEVDVVVAIVILEGKVAATVPLPDPAISPFMVKPLPASIKVPLVSDKVPPKTKSAGRVTVLFEFTLTVTLFNPEPVSSTPATEELFV